MNKVRTGNLYKISGAFMISALAFVACNKNQVMDSEMAAAPTQEAIAVNATLTPLQALGKKIYFDSTLSESGSAEKGVQACASCHLPQFGFAAPGDAASTPLYKRSFVAGFAEGAVAGKFGGRKAPTAAYTSFSPKLENFGVGLFAEFAGGMFWDGRATGWNLNSPLAEQAQGPFLNPVEQNHANAKAVLVKIQANANNYYGTMWQQAFGTALATTTTAQVNTAYNNLGKALAAYMGSAELNQFSSKYDKSLVRQATLTAAEQRGLTVFNTVGTCVACHTMGVNAAKEPFTDYGYDNIGIPRNPSPLAPAVADAGFGGFLATQKINLMWRQFATASRGLFKTPTVRNLTVGGNRRYGHNGFFTSVEQIVHFYNTAAVPGAGWNGQPWPAPETPVAVDAGGVAFGVLGNVGNLGLTLAQEADLVAFLKTLNDGWSPTAVNGVGGN